MFSGFTDVVARVVVSVLGQGCMLSQGLSARPAAPDTGAAPPRGH